MLIFLTTGLSSVERRGPQLMVEPQNRVEFLNDTRTVITCSARGSPEPTIQWLKSDGTPLTDREGVVQVVNSGHTSQVVYQPFAANHYRQDIHWASIRCLATNTIGAVESRECHIRASALQRDIHSECESIK
ncbi:unnamed protein product [Oppiella nova]|uniref:Ig-like domain-containing protein n=1 Tax=Oppiella nova TaxID=334625 RepID=A0A7R9QJS5_9ACAR|nr:unnamed protein product [Oppiella nova]CAG2167113.1 unnamed protein product [Oppiella nova]